MFLIREKSIVLAGLCVAAALAGIGCASSSCAYLRPRQPVVSKTPVPIAEQPLADEAIEIRGWHKSIAWYQSGATQAWPTRWYYEPNRDYSTGASFAIDSLSFLGQGASLPVTLVEEPPFMQPVVYRGDVIPPSYTAMPPLPPERPTARTVPNPDPLAAPHRSVAPPLPPIPEPLPPTYVPPVTKTVKPATTVAPTTRPAQ